MYVTLLVFFRKKNFNQSEAFLWNGLGSMYFSPPRRVPMTPASFEPFELLAHQKASCSSDFSLTSTTLVKKGFDWSFESRNGEVCAALSFQTPSSCLQPVFFVPWVFAVFAQSVFLSTMTGDGHIVMRLTPDGLYQVVFRPVNRSPMSG